MMALSATYEYIYPTYRQMNIRLFRDITPCNLTDNYQSYGETCCFHILSSRWMQHFLRMVSISLADYTVSHRRRQ